MNQIIKLQEFINNRLEWDDRGNNNNFSVKKQAQSPVFILCPARSGSTLLRVMLAGSPNVFAPPELELLSFTNLKQRHTALSVRVDFLLEGLIRATMALKNCSAEEAKSILATYEEQQMPTASFYNTLQEWCGDKILVDKSVHYAMSPIILERAEQYFENARYIHLSRHPYGTIESIQRLEMHKELYGSIKGFSEEELASYTWQICHQNILAFLENIPTERQTQVRFEDLVTTPEATMRELCDFLHIDYHEEMLQPYKDKEKRMTDTAAGDMMIGDPNFHERQQIDAKAVTSWKQADKLPRLGEKGQATASRLKYWDTSTPRELQSSWLSASNLNAQQWQIWLESQRTPALAKAYSTTWCFELPVNTDLPKFQQAFSKVVESNSLLKTIFYTQKGIPSQRQAKDIVTEIAISKGKLSLEAANELVINRVIDTTKRCWDSLLIPLNNGKWQWSFKIHHLVGCVIDIPALLDNIAMAYKGEDYSKNSQFQPIPAIDKATYQKASEFWKSTPPSNINSWYGNIQRVITTETHRQSLDLSSNLLKTLNQASKQLEIKVATALAITLGQVTDGTQIGMGMPSKRTNIPSLLPVSLVLDKEQSIKAVLETIQSKYQSAEAFNNYNLAVTIDSPVYQAAIQYTYPLVLAIESQEKSASVLAAQAALPTVVVHLENDVEKNLTGIQLECNKALFPKEVMTLLAGHLEQALKQVVQEADKKVAAVNLLTSTEIANLAKWNATEVEFPEDKTINELFEEQVSRTPNNIAVKFKNTQFTYRELNEKANQLGHYLKETYQIKPNDVVAIQMQRSEWITIAILGILKSGATWLPIANDLPEKRVAYVLEDSQAVALLTNTPQFEISQQLDIEVPVVDIESTDYTDWSITNVQNDTTSEDTAYIIYTSGTTGAPKGTILNHKGPINTMLGVIDIWNISEADKCLQFANYVFDASILETLPPLFTGATLIITPTEILAEPTSFIQMMNKEEISLALLMPAFLASLGNQSFPKLRVLITGGEKPRTQNVIHYSKECRYYNIYGPTECSVFVSYYEVGEEVPDVIPVGKPLPNTKFHILDSKLRMVPVGIVGELYVAGVSLGKGYLNRPEKTAEAFVPHPLKKGEKLYKTGDFARWLPDGNVEFLGRRDHQIKIRSIRIETEEVEKSLTQHAAIKTAFVTGKHLQGKTEMELVAYLIAVQGQTMPDEATLRQFAAENLPEYMIPSYFITLDAFPTNTSGKVDTKALPEPETATWRSSVPYVEPSTEVERTLVAIWEEVLEINPIGINDDFFDLGGHSLKAIQISVKMSAAFHMDLPVKLLFSSPTIASLSKKVGEYKYGDYHFEEGIAFNSEANQTLFAFPIVFGLGIDYEPLTKHFPDIRWYCFDFLVAENRLELYYQQIKKQQPQGPYVFFGHSIGGVLAFDMARYMESKGETVSDIILGDSFVRLAPKPFDFKAYLDDFFAHWIDTPLGKQLLILIQNEDFYKQTENRLTAYNDFANALNIHPPTKATIHQIQATEGEMKDNKALSTDWSECTIGEFKNYPTPGDHGTIFEEPNIKQSAQVIRQVLAAANNNILVNI